MERSLNRFLGNKVTVVTWCIFTMWLLFNLGDIAISLEAIQLGAGEVGLLYIASGNWLSLVISKIGLAILIGWILVYSWKIDWLALLTLGMFGVCIYDLWVLLHQMGVL